MELHELRYTISDWRQARKCLSNTSRKLHIEVAEYVQNADIVGLQLAVKHELYGYLFVTTIRCTGNILDPDIPDLSNEDILQQLARFGFLITYVPEANLKGSQLDCLANLQEIGFDKITRVTVMRREDNHRSKYKAIVAFKSADNTDLIPFDYVISALDFTCRLDKGTVFNLNEISYNEQFDWTWLKSTVNIEDILQANSVVTPQDIIPDVEVDTSETLDPVPSSADEGLIDTEGYHIYDEGGSSDGE